MQSAANDLDSLTPEHSKQEKFPYDSDYHLHLDDRGPMK